MINMYKEKTNNKFLKPYGIYTHVKANFHQADDITFYVLENT